jgi:hypothetical protein
LLLNVGSGGGAAAAPAAGGAGGAAGGDAAPEAAKEEAKEEGTFRLCLLRRVLSCWLEQLDVLNEQILGSFGLTRHYCCRKGRVRRGYGFRSFRLSNLTNRLLLIHSSILTNPYEYPLSNNKSSAISCFHAYGFGLGVFNLLLVSVEWVNLEVESARRISQSR